LSSSESSSSRSASDIVTVQHPTLPTQHTAVLQKAEKLYTDLCIFSAPTTS
jgi:hypothetical protein